MQMDWMRTKILEYVKNASAARIRVIYFYLFG